ncbi:ROK family protein [Paenibacillus yanchengensis]|uniref:ROK family protein n=1 Tax=Paenibacillus yanchengensis TaxID=2035833 RepID=A0ABW4YHI5_9BACL
MKNNTSYDQKGSKINIIQALLKNGPMSRIELTRFTNLSRATISATVAELMDSELVQETSSQYSTGGRPATLINLTPHSRVIVGADYSNQTWTLGAFDLLGNTVKEVTIPVSDSTIETVIQSLVTSLEHFIDQLVEKPIELIGLGMPGLVDVNRGVIVSASNIGWYNVEIVKKIKERMNWEVVAINRHRARGLAECRFGVGKDFGEIVYIGIGTGIAAGLFHNRQILFGAIGGAGELGHITVDPNGPWCPCGNNGCLQQLATSSAMEQELRRMLRSGKVSSIYPDSSYDLQLIKSADIGKGADEGDQLCMEVVEKAATYLGIAMANLINIVNPETIILGGTVPMESEYYIKVATDVMHRRALSPLNSNVQVLRASQNDLGGALGAANFALDQHVGTISF